jgi:hypothetical protein
MSYVYAFYMVSRSKIDTAAFHGTRSGEFNTIFDPLFFPENLSQIPDVTDVSRRLLSDSSLYAPFINDLQVLSVIT